MGIKMINLVGSFWTPYFFFYTVVGYIVKINGYTRKDINMNPDELLKTLEDAAGFITVDDNGMSVCTVCGAAANAGSTITHSESCDYKKAVDVLLEKLPPFDNKIIPGIENQVSLAMMLPYYAELSKEELREIEDLTKDMMLKEPIENRIATAKLIGYWCPSCDAELLQRIIENGIQTEQARINVRNYFVFERVTNKKINAIKKELQSTQEMQESMAPVFEQLLTKKYGYERYTQQKSE